MKFVQKYVEMVSRYSLNVMMVIERMGMDVLRNVISNKILFVNRIPNRKQ